MSLFFVVSGSILLGVWVLAGLFLGFFVKGSKHYVQPN